jgi:hypothetical protein
MFYTAHVGFAVVLLKTIVLWVQGPELETGFTRFPPPHGERNFLECHTASFGRGNWLPVEPFRHLFFDFFFFSNVSILESEISSRDTYASQVSWASAPAW